MHCFDSCQRSCAQEIASSGNLYLSCFLSGCGIKSQSSRSSDILTTSPRTDINQLVPDYSAVARKAGQPRAIAFHDTGTFQRGIGVKGEAVLTINLKNLRKQGFRFDYFSARVGMDSAAPGNCSVQRLMVKISTDRYEPLITRVGKLKSKEILYRVKQASHLELSIVPSNSSKANNCHYSAWGEAKLTDGIPLFPSCLGHCTIRAHSQKLPLSCVMGSCPGQEVHKKVKDIMRLEKDRSDTQICVDYPCHTESDEKKIITARGITMTTGGTVSFNLTEIRQLGYKADILKTNLSVIARCSQMNASVRPKRGINIIFEATLDRTNIYKRTFHELTSGDQSEVEVVLDVSQGSRIALTVNGTSNDVCAVAIWKNAHLEGSKPYQFEKCHKKCQEAAEHGHIYLSCFIGVCSAQVTYKSNEPFFTLHHQRWGIGADRPGGWKDGRNNIRFKHAPLFESSHGSVQILDCNFGIGAYSPSSMTFNLNAFREHGFHFNAFSVIIGIDVNSGCRNTTGSIFQIYLDNSHSPVFDKYVATMDSVHELLVPVKNASKLRLTTLNMFGHLCSNAAWGLAQLVEISPMNFSL